MVVCPLTMILGGRGTLQAYVWGSLFREDCSWGS